MIGSEADVPAETVVDRVALRVNDLDRQTEFYRDVVGLEVVDESDDRADLGVGGDPLVSLRAVPNAPERASDETGLYHAAFRVPSRSALADVLVRVRDRWRLDGASDHRISEALYFDDPEGNGIEAYRDRPREDWPIAADGTLLLDTESLDLGALRGDAGGGETVPTETDLGHVHLEVSSIPVAEAFYVDALGMNVRFRYREAMLFVAAGDYHHHVGLNTFANRTKPPTGRGLEGVELVLRDRESLDAIAERIEAHGGTATLAAGVVEATDPDGIALRLRAAE